MFLMHKLIKALLSYYLKYSSAFLAVICVSSLLVNSKSFLHYFCLLCFVGHARWNNRLWDLAFSDVTTAILTQWHPSSEITTSARCCFLLAVLFLSPFKHVEAATKHWVLAGSRAPAVHVGGSPLVVSPAKDLNVTIIWDVERFTPLILFSNYIHVSNRIFF